MQAPRYLTVQEKRNLIARARAEHLAKNPDAQFHVEVDDLTDNRGRPRYSIVVKTAAVPNRKRGI